jgi:DMSO/TMAO reductase YedYZ molybdopterin-dependent catalytic subunit
MMGQCDGKERIVDSEKRERIVRSRLRLRERFADAMASTPAQADDRPQGTGEPNRHGMPRLPVGQVETQKWPVLDLGHHPRIEPANWQLVIDGACARPEVLTWSALMGMEQVEDVSDFHCVTRWSRMDIPWQGVRFRELMARVEPHEDARFVMCYGADDYTTNVPLCEALKDDVLLAYGADGAPLTVAHGGPVRMITPQLYAWKGTKWVTRIELMVEDRLGFWEVRGYSNSAHPWRGDRYS